MKLISPRRALLITSLFFSMASLATPCMGAIIAEANFDTPSSAPGDYGFYVATGSAGSSTLSIDNGALKFVQNELRTDGAMDYFFVQFSGTSLAVGETLRISFSVTNFNAAGSNSASGVRMAVMNLPSSPGNVSSLPNSGFSTGGRGYGFWLGMGTSSGASYSGASSNINDPLSIGGAPYSANNASSTANLTNASKPVTLVLEITRVSTTSMQLGGSLGAIGFNNLETTGGNNFYNFNTFALGFQKMGPDRGISIDNFKVEVIPEPGTSALLVVCGGLCLLGRRVGTRQRQ